MTNPKRPVKVEAGKYYIIHSENYAHNTSGSNIPVGWGKWKDAAAVYPSWKELQNAPIRTVKHDEASHQDWVLWEVVSVDYGFSFTMNEIFIFEAPSTESHQCRCSSHILWVAGCRCGGN